MGTGPWDGEHGSTILNQSLPKIAPAVSLRSPHSPCYPTPLSLLTTPIFWNMILKHKGKLTCPGHHCPFGVYNRIQTQTPV